MQENVNQMAASVSDLGSLEPQALSPVTAFFSAMPSPEDHHRKAWSETGKILEKAMATFIALSANNRSTDPDYELLESYQEGICRPERRSGGLRAVGRLVSVYHHSRA